MFFCLEIDYIFFGAGLQGFYGVVCDPEEVIELSFK